MLKIVCSGCQTGADIGGLLIAEQFGIKTGGWCPKNCRTENGDRPEFIERFGLRETTTNNYVPRTYANAKMGDGTIRFAFNFESAGEKVTLQACQKYKKPVIDVDVTVPRHVDEVVNWIKENNIEILNVAGNSESKHPGIREFVKDYLSQVFVLLGH